MAAAVVAFAVGAAGPALADCTLSDPPTIPDGSAAAEAEMLAAQESIKNYVAETQEFLSCLEFQSRGRNDRDTMRRYDQATAQMEKLASEFNKQLRAFRSR